MIPTFEAIQVPRPIVIGAEKFWKYLPVISLNMLMSSGWNRRFRPVETTCRGETGQGMRRLNLRIFWKRIPRRTHFQPTKESSK